MHHLWASCLIPTLPEPCCAAVGLVLGWHKPAVQGCTSMQHSAMLAAM